MVILDWYLNIERDEEQQLDPNADADNDEPRGEFILKLLKQLTNGAETEKLKLIIVYTGETDLFEITNSICKEVNQCSLNQEDCVIRSLNVKILVRAKSQNSGTQFAHNPELKDEIVLNII